MFTIHSAVNGNNYTRAQLIAEMLEVGFTQEEAEAGADWVDLNE